MCYISSVIHTPKYHIPIGEGIKLEDGTYALRVKKPGKDAYEIVSLDALFHRVMQVTESGNNNDREPPLSRHPSPPIDSSI